ncbi:hypothetical protein Sango_0938300 [Sesamum angolense]|uniref:Uncharacterized protein n=1 Tax=Sesamum angolense TaxID=2727404 RepID=A0AAE2BY34_9LAMI|nr:hypothetical protein Sango_0938300 [Sesamum angolense]
MGFEKNASEEKWLSFLVHIEGFVGELNLSLKVVLLELEIVVMFCGNCFSRTLFSNLYRGNVVVSPNSVILLKERNTSPRFSRIYISIGLCSVSNHRAGRGRGSRLASAALVHEAKYKCRVDFGLEERSSLVLRCLAFYDVYYDASTEVAILGDPEMNLGSGNGLDHCSAIANGKHSVTAIMYASRDVNRVRSTCVRGQGWCVLLHRSDDRLSSGVSVSTALVIVSRPAFLGAPGKDVWNLRCANLCMGRVHLVLIGNHMPSVKWAAMAARREHVARHLAVSCAYGPFGKELVCLTMANSKGPSSIRSMLYNGKNSLLPPKSPFPSISPSYAEYIPSSAIGPKTLPKPRDGNSHHQRTSSESFLIEEQPSWLMNSLMSQKHLYGKGVIAGHQVIPLHILTRDARQSSFYADQNPSIKTKHKPWDAPVAPPRGLPSPRGNTLVQNVGSLGTSQDADKNPSLSTEKQDLVESAPQDPKGSTEKKDSCHAKSSETDTKRAKQQKVLKFLLNSNSQPANLILSMENKALKQRLESLAQEQLIKYLEHEVLEREVGRLRALYQQQQQPQQQTSSGHRRANSRDLDQQFANLSLKPKEATAGRDSVPGQLHM